MGPQGSERYGFWSKNDRMANCEKVVLPVLVRPTDVSKCPQIHIAMIQSALHPLL